MSDVIKKGLKDEVFYKALIGLLEEKANASMHEAVQKGDTDFQKGEYAGKRAIITIIKSLGDTTETPDKES